MKPKHIQLTYLSAIQRSQKPPGAADKQNEDSGWQSARTSATIKKIKKGANIMAKQTKVLYHYTSMENLQWILKLRYIKTTPSNLLRPRNLKPFYNVAIDTATKDCQIISRALVDKATDWFKPVVWMTDSESPEGLGLPNPKKRVRLSIPVQRHFKKWNKWAKQNNMAPHLMKGLTKGMNWQSWYISEFKVSLDDVSEILDTATNTVIDFQHELIS